jgi:DNA-directed RNA polymerase I subunit RPA49
MESFCPNGMGPSKFKMTLLRTTILALTLHIPPPSGRVGSGILANQPYDIQVDLNLQADEVRHLYRELGCKWESTSEAELERWGYVKLKKTKEMGQAPRFAKLKFPVEFPKMSRGRPTPR